MSTQPSTSEKGPPAAMKESGAEAPKDEKPKTWRDYHANVLVERSDLQELEKLEKLLGFRSHKALIKYMILETGKGALIPPASYEIIFERDQNRPCLITAESGGGKTTIVKELLSHWTGNVFLLDVSDEYKELRAVDLGEFFSTKWAKPDQRIRFVPNSNVEISKAEAATIFSHLNFVKNSAELKDWVIIIEEGHRFSNDANLRALLIEARKFVRKLILITTDWRVYEGAARVYRPPPWEK